MGMDFPVPVAVDEVFTDATSGASYQWDGVAWNSAGSGAVSPDAEFLPLTGGTMTGAIQLPSTQPTTTTQSTHKQYVDTAIAAKALYQGVWQVAANSPDLTPSVANPLHSYSWIANTVDPNLPETAPAALPGIGGLLITSSDTVIWNDTTSVYELVRSPASVSGDFVEVTGDSMTGPLKVAGDGTVGQVWLTNGTATANGQLEFRAADDTRAAYMGWGNASTISLALEGASVFHVTGGNIQADGGVTMGSATAATAQDLTRHLALYGTTFGFNVTGGTLNYVVPTSNKHDFHVGTELVASVKNDGIHTLGDNGITVAGNANVAGQIIVAGGIRVTNHMALAIEGNGTLAVGGASTFTGVLNANSGINIGADQDIYYSSGVNTGYSAANGHYYNVTSFHTFWVSGTQRMGIDSSGVTVYGTITDALVADAVKKDPKLPGKNIGALLLHALAEIKTLKAEVAALKARK